MRQIIVICCVLLLSGCAGMNAKAPPQTVGEVDLQRYQGTWYELARLPMFFQRNCVESQAHYQLRDDGSIAVTNRCRTEDGHWQQAEGRAVPDQGRTDRLVVRFDNWFSNFLPGLTKGKYWVLYLDPDYRVALVGSPDRDYLWLLAREQEVDAATRAKLLAVAREQGYDLDELIWRGENP